MQQSIAQLSLLVHDYDEAIEFFTRKLNFILVEDTPLTETKRWVVVQPNGSTGCRLLLARAANEEQRSRVGNQTGGRVFLFLHTDNLQRDFENLVKQNIKIHRGPLTEP